MPRPHAPSARRRPERLVRGCRAAAAVARRRRVAVGRARERVHAAADAGRAGRPAVGGVDRAVADAGRARRGAARRRRVRAWDRLGYPRRALWLHRAAVEIVERHGGEVPRRPRRPARAAGRRPVHGTCGRGVRVRPAASGGRHQHPTGASPAPSLGQAHAGPAVDGARPRRDGGAAAGDGCRGAHVQRRRDGARRDGVHRTRARVRRMPDRRAPARGARRATRRTTARGRPCRRASRAPTGRCAGSSCASCGRRTAPSRGRSSSPSGRMPRSSTARSTALVADGLAVTEGDGLRLPDA